MINYLEKEDIDRTNRPERGTLKRKENETIYYYGHNYVYFAYSIDILKYVIYYNRVTTNSGS